MARSIRSSFVVTTVLAAMLAACATVRMGGKTVFEVFDDPKAVELTLAAMRGDSEEVARLARAGAPVNLTGEGQCTPLIWAQYVNNLAGMGALLKAGADPNQKTVAGVSALTWAAGSDKPKQLALLLQYGGNPNADDTGKIEDRPLVRAAYHSRFENVRTLLAAGADVNVHDKYAESAPKKSVSMGDFETVAYFLDHGYTYDLQSLARSVEIRVVPRDSDRQRWKDTVIEMLKARGVRFPAYIPCYPPGDPRRNEENCRRSEAELERLRGRLIDGQPASPNR
jgi:uncharacterized protein